MSFGFSYLAAGSLNISFSHAGAVSSVGLERCFDRAEVAGSNPVQPTLSFSLPIFFRKQNPTLLLFRTGVTRIHRSIVVGTVIRTIGA